MIWLAACVLAAVPAAATVHKRDAKHPSAPRAAAQPSMPARQRELIALIAEGRRAYDAAPAGLAQINARLDLQIRMTRFVNGESEAKGWLGIVRSSEKTLEGDRVFSVEVGPGVIVGTCENRYHDPDLLTLILPHSSIYKTVGKLEIGQPVVFDATILKGRYSTDDDMVRRPFLVAHFSDVKAASGSPTW
jgi:hypothetical protein